MVKMVDNRGYCIVEIQAFIDRRQKRFERLDLEKPFLDFISRGDQIGDISLADNQKAVSAIAVPFQKLKGQREPGRSPIRQDKPQLIVVLVLGSGDEFVDRVLRPRQIIGMEAGKGELSVEPGMARFFGAHHPQFLA